MSILAPIRWLFLGAINGIEKCSEIFESTAIPKPKTETLEVDNYEQLALKEVNAIAPEE